MDAVGHYNLIRVCFCKGANLFYFHVLPTEFLTIIFRNSVFLTSVLTL